MKKILAVVLSLAMILSMSVCAFAAPVAPVDTADVAAWTTYYTDVILDAEMSETEKVLVLTDNTLNTVYVDAINGAIAAADAQDVDTAWVVNAINTKEDHLGQDINGDGRLGVAGVPVSPTDVEAWTAYYTELFSTVTENPLAVATVVSTVAGDITSGAIDMDTLASVLPAVAENVGGEVVNQIIWGVESLISMDINSDGYVGKPDGTQLPPAGDEGEGDEGNAGSGLTDILNTILGVIGGLLDSIINPDKGDTPTTPTEPDDDNLWGDDDAWGDDSSTIPDTGDTTVFAVAAVALVAGAALVMTRKKNEDAE